MPELMPAMKIDVLTDLSGQTKGTSLNILTHRPVTGEVTYLGLPGKMDLPCNDYITFDPRIIQHGQDQDYSR